MIRPAALALILSAAITTGAAAAPVPDYIKDNVGTWLVATDDGKPGCRIALTSERAGADWRATPAAECAARLPAVGRAAAWTYEGGVRLVGADGKTLLDFQEDETTVMKTSFERPPVHFIVQAKAGVERAPYAPGLVGAWVLRRPNGPALCPLTLSKGPKDEATELTVKAGTPCDAAVARLRLDRARVEDFALMLYGRPETSLRLEPSGADAYAKAEAGKPLEMVRAP